VIGVALLGAVRMARVHAKAIGAAGGRLVTVYDDVEPAAKFPGRRYASARRIVFSCSTWTVRGRATAGKSKPFFGSVAACTQPPTNAIDGLRTAYLGSSQNLFQNVR
jgi:hypothetical protein